MHDATAAAVRAAAARATDAGIVADQIVNDYGIGSPQATQALTTAQHLTHAAENIGCTPTDFIAARRRTGRI